MCSWAPAGPSGRRDHLRHVASRPWGPWGHARFKPASARAQPPGPAHTCLQAPPSLDCYWLPTRTSCSVARLKEVGEELVVRSRGSLVPPPVSHVAARGLGRRVRQSRDMAEGGGWQVSAVGPGDPRGQVGRTETGSVRAGRAGAHRVPRSLLRPRPRSRRARARPTAPSGSSAAAPATSCATTTSTASGRPACSGGATWTAAASGRSVAAPRPR